MVINCGSDLRKFVFNTQLTSTTALAQHFQAPKGIEFYAADAGAWTASNWLGDWYRAIEVQAEIYIRILLGPMGFPHQIFQLPPRRQLESNILQLPTIVAAANCNAV